MRKIAFWAGIILLLGYWMIQIISAVEIPEQFISMIVVNFVALLLIVLGLSGITNH